jgi:hypothetical protein
MKLQFVDSDFSQLYFICRIEFNALRFERYHFSGSHKFKTQIRTTYTCVLFVRAFVIYLTSSEKLKAEAVPLHAT